MTRISTDKEFTDDIFTRDRRTWWAGFETPGVNICTAERLDVTAAFDRYLDWTVDKVRLAEIDRIDMGGGDVATMLGEETEMFTHKRSDTGARLGYSTERFVVVQNQQVRDLMAEALDGIDYAVASVGALKSGAVTFASVDFTDAPSINAGGQVILPFLAIANYHDGGGSLKAYGTGIRPECLNTIDFGWLAGVQLGRLNHTTNILDRVPELQDEIRRYLDLAPLAERTVERLIAASTTPALYREAVERLTPIPEPVIIEGVVKNRTAITRAENRREAITELAFEDPRVGFQDTAWGLFQTLSTYGQKERGIRRVAGTTTRPQTNLAAFYTGKQLLEDRESLTLALAALDVKGVKVSARGVLVG